MTTSPNLEKTPAIDSSGWEHLDGDAPTAEDNPVVAELATLLPRVAALASYLNTNKCTDQDRARLRELVPSLTYMLMVCNLASLRSHAARRAPGRTDQLTIDLLTFSDHYHEPAPPTKPSRSRRR